LNFFNARNIYNKTFDSVTGNVTAAQKETQLIGAKMALPLINLGAAMYVYPDRVDYGLTLLNWNAGNQGLISYTNLGCHLGIIGFRLENTTNNVSGFIKAYPSSRQQMHERGILLPLR